MSLVDKSGMIKDQIVIDNRQKMVAVKGRLVRPAHHNHNHNHHHHHYVPFTPQWSTGPTPQQ
jgi:hypothetical protein